MFNRKKVFYLFSLIVVYMFCDYVSAASKEEELQQKVIKLVKIYAKEIGERLYTLSNSMTQPKKIEESFAPLEIKIETVGGMKILEKLARSLRELMDNKTAAVKNISEYAEFLSYYRQDDPLFPNGTYDYYNADNVTDSDDDDERMKVKKDIQYAECRWFCQQQNRRPLSYNIYKKQDLEALYRARNFNEEMNDCDCRNVLSEDKEPSFYWTLPMEYDARFDEKVNLNLSIIKTATNVYYREQKVLEGARWSEALDFVFKDNMLRDPTLTWQYFASPHGFMRHYPAIKWSDEAYDQTYDFRTRSWYTEAMTSPKNIMILVDNSGSMHGTHRALCAHIVNDILDTLNDNDFVNIYTFNNRTDPLVSCFNNTLVQANEENLRLLRESLPVYEDIFVSDIILGLKRAFEILQHFKKYRANNTCNQAIMLITAGVDYDFDINVFKHFNNWDTSQLPVRIFTYQIGRDCTDARHMEWIACANRGYYVNMTVLSDVREKILNYMNVLSRPINYDFKNKATEIWSYLHVDLADRRFSNWLWRKFEGNRQREVFLDHVKRDYIRLKKTLTSRSHMLLREEHEFQKYKKKFDYNYMTTVSLPVYGRRDEEIDLIGVAGVDVPIKLLRNFIPYHRLGVNGYAFICTNNGYVLMHPDHRPEFKNILKPTFNRVDFLEVEILDDSSQPRLFNETIVHLREKVVRSQQWDQVLSVKFTINEMKRVVLSEREYFLTKLGPFTLGIALPAKYGKIKVQENAKQFFATAIGLLKTKNWKVHPDWIYCKNCEGKTPEEKIVNLLRKNLGTKEMEPLFSMMLYDANRTIWFEDDLDAEQNLFIKKYFVNKIFLSTHSGLTRWRTFNVTFVDEDDRDSFETRNSRSIDEDWYRRSVEENYKDERRFIYSVPFEISGYENNTMITGTKAIFLKNGAVKTPIAVVGLQFNHRAMYELYNDITLKSFNITTKCGKAKYCNITCESDYLDCFILDNNAYIVLSDEIEYTGRYIGDIRADIMYHLIQDGVFKDTRMFDYQAICQKEPPEKKKKNSANSPPIRFRKLVQHLLGATNWALATVLFWVRSIMAGPAYQSIKEDTIAVEKLEIKKTYPTPCDHEFWLFTLGDKFQNSVFHKNATKFDCDWPYVVEKNS
ncbi:unnamed protein product [Brassicogethes aeneus]|uniref:VWFA domain-containing protein n=1 Tax=Brassicogethes aeneus TaxID=1431903 RepID=A0A9P0FMK7_BRAAE|nr:unnamed protein product [Brassicogethes aeneus]